MKLTFSIKDNNKKWGGGRKKKTWSFIMMSPNKTQQKAKSTYIYDNCVNENIASMCVIKHLLNFSDWKMVPAYWVCESDVIR